MTAPQDTSPRARALAAVLAVGLVCVVVVLGLAAAGGGTPDLLPGEGSSPGRLGPGVATPSPEEIGAEADGGDQRTRDGESWLGYVIGAVVLAAAVLVAVVVAALLWRLLRDRWERRTRDEAILGVDGEPLPDDDVRRVGRALAEGAAEQDALLASGSPRNGVVACWQWFEERAEAAGLGREGWETSTEFTTRLLTSTDADPGAIARLAGLYREARFSDHPVTEDQREQARRELLAVREGLRARSPRGSAL